MRINRTIGVGGGLAALALFLILSVTAGCAARNNAEGGVKAQRYSDDGYMGITNSYPKIPSRHMALNYASDANMMRDAIRDVQGVAGANVTFNGPDAYVTVKLQPGVADRQIPTVERQAAAVLRFNFPRYNVYVSSSR